MSHVRSKVLSELYTLILRRTGLLDQVLGLIWWDFVHEDLILQDHVPGPRTLPFTKTRLKFLRHQRLVIAPHHLVHSHSLVEHECTPLVTKYMKKYLSVEKNMGIIKRENWNNLTRKLSPKKDFH